MLSHLVWNDVAERLRAVDRIVQYRRAGRVIMVLSDRIVQLELLRALVVQRGVPEDEVGVPRGASDRTTPAPEQLARPIVMCSYGMANEGVDKKEAVGLHLCGRDTGARDPGSGASSARARRWTTRSSSTSSTSILQRLSMRWSRQRVYTREGYALLAQRRRRPRGGHGRS